MPVPALSSRHRKMYSVLETMVLYLGVDAAHNGNNNFKTCGPHCHPVMPYVVLIARVKT